MQTEPSAKPKGDALLTTVEQATLAKAQKSHRSAISLSVLAGVYIGIAFIFYITVLTGSNDLPWGISRLIGGLVFSLGLILVVVARAELFTSTVLTVIPCASGQLSVTQMLKHWGRVYAGNMLGALFLVMLVLCAGLPELNAGQWGLKAMSVASSKLEHGFFQAIALGALCNLLVCLGIWLTYTTEDVGAKAALVVLPVAMFVSSGFEHSIANAFLIPLGIAIHNMADAAFWLEIGVDSAKYAKLTMGNFLFNNLIPVTIGNIIGGAVFVGLFHWWLHGAPIDRTAKARANLDEAQWVINSGNWLKSKAKKAKKQINKSKAVAINQYQKSKMTARSEQDK